MEFGVLGPLRAVAADGSEVPLGGPKQRSVLALLLVEADRIVVVDRIIEELWPETTSDASRKTVQAYVSRLRNAFASAGATKVIEARPGGYVLASDGHTIDSRRFEAVLMAARDSRISRPVAAAADLEESLATWRGRPFEDVVATPLLEREAERLDELRLDAFEVWAEAQLAAGRHREVLADLRRLAQENPTRERLWEYLMLALYRSGRQSESLQLYVEVARLLTTEYGIDPGPELALMQRRILEQDPGLHAPEPDTADASPTREAAVPEAGASRRWLAVPSVVALVVIAAVATAAFLLVSAADHGASVAIGASHEVPAAASEIVAGGGRIWMLVDGSTSLTALDLGRETITQHDIAVEPTAIAAGLGHIWVASEDARQVLKIHAERGSVVDRAEGIDVSGARLVVGPDAVWLIREHPSPFVRIDPRDLSMEVLPFVDGFGGPAQPDLAVADGMLWGSNAYIGRIMSLDPASGQFDFAGDPRSGEHAARSILADHGGIWFSQPTNGSVTRVDAGSGEVSATALIGATSSAGFGRLVPPYALTVGPGGVWVALPRDHKVVLLDDQDARVLAQVELVQPISMAASGGRVWVLDAGSDRLVELEPRTCESIPEVVPGADLRGCDLRSKAFVGADLSGADLRWSDLRLAAMQGTDLRGADLMGADLTGAALEHIRWGATRCPDGSLSDDNGGRCRSRR